MKARRIRAATFATLATAMGATAMGVTASGCGGDRASVVGDGGVPTLAITSPAADAYTNGLIAIEVSVMPAPPAGFEVRLFKNGLPFAGLTGPYTFPWDTTYETEGSYEIEARATVGGRMVTSTPVTVVIDRTPPTIVSQKPSHRSDNVPLREPIRLIFSEPLSRASVSSSSVALTAGATGVPSTVTLEPDEKTITVSISAPGEVALPKEMSLAVSTSVTDLAGNAFVAIAPTTWAVPLWLDLGLPPWDVQELVLSPNGVPFALGDSPLAKVARHVSGKTWDDSYGSPQTNGSRQTVLAVDGYDNPYLAYFDVPDLEGLPVSLARWTGTTWDKNFGRLQVNKGPGLMVSPPLSLAIDHENRPVINWGEQTNSYVARWSGTAWQFPFGAESVGGFSMVLGDLDQPALIAAGGQGSTPAIVRWAGTTWLKPTMQGPGEGFLAGQIRFDSMHRLIALTVAGRVLRGDTFEEVAPSPSVGPSLQEAKLALDSHDSPIVAWNAGTAMKMARWTGTTWDTSSVKVSDMGDAELYLIAMAIDGNDNIFIAWREATSDFSLRRTYVRRSNR